MPAWSVALLVAFVGLAGASIGTFANISNDRSKDSRTRMLDAADEFVTAVTRAQEALGSAAIPTSLWVEIAWMEITDEMREDRQGKVEAAHATANSEWEGARHRVPRVALLFGVDSPTADAARRTDEALGEALVGLSGAYAESLDPVAEPVDENLILDRATERLDVATSALREFSAAAHTAISSRPMWRRSASAKPAET